MLCMYVWMLISIGNYEYDLILLIFLNTDCWSLVQDQDNSLLKNETDPIP